MALSSTYQSTGLPLLSTLYEPPPKHLISVLVIDPGVRITQGFWRYRHQALKGNWLRVL